MDALTVLKNLDSKGIRATAEDGRLFLEPEDRVTPDDGAAAKAVKTDLLAVLAQPNRDGSPLERLVYEIRDARLIAEQRRRAIQLQTWLTDNLDKHLSAEPSGLPSWLANLTEFDIVERGHLREVFHYQGCIHESGHCPAGAAVSCTNCETNGEPE